MARAARLRVLVPVALVAVATACGPTTATTSAPTASVVPRADCLAPEVLDQLGLTLDPSLAVKASQPVESLAGTVPDGFVPTSVLVCQVGGQMRDSAGTWTAVTATSREGSAADTAALAAAIAADEHTGPPPAPSSCGPDDRPAVLWLLDAVDRAVRPALATDGCGAPDAAVRAALDRLPVTGVVDHPVQLVSPAR